MPDLNRRLCSLTLVVAVGCGGGGTTRPAPRAAPATTTAARDGQLFVDASVGFQIELPAGWHLQRGAEAVDSATPDASTMPEALVTATKYPVDYAALNPAIAIVMRPRPESIDAAAVVEATLNLFGSGFTEFAIVETPAARTLGGVQGAGARFRYSAPLADGSARLAIEGRLYVATRGDDVFVITMTGSQAGDDRCEDEFRAALASIRIAPAR